MDDLNVFEQYYPAEMTANGRIRHAALVMLTAKSGEDGLCYEAAASFFPHDDEEDYAVSGDAYFGWVVLSGLKRRSRKKEAECLQHFREVIDELVKNPENAADYTDGALWTPGKICWDRPLRPARGEWELPPYSGEQ